MPLQRAKVEFLGTSVGGICFRMRDGIKEVRCRMSLEALRDRSAAISLDEAGVLENYREEIEQAASAKYDRGQISSDGCI
jgi:hypothetical protein